MSDSANLYEVHAANITGVGDGSIPFDRTAKNGSPHVGKALMQTGENTYGLVTDGFEIAGKLMKVEPDGFITMQDEGYCDLPTDGTAITYTKTNNGLVGGATAGTVRSALAEEAVGAVRGAKAIKGDGTNKVIAKLC